MPGSFTYPICDTAFLFGQKISGRGAAEEMENTKMKKIIAIVLAALSVVAFAACGKKDDAPKPGTLKEGETIESVLEAVDAKFSDRYGSDYAAVAMGMPVDDAYLSDFLELDSSAYDEYAGNVSMSMTNSDAFFVIKAKEGQVEAVQQALEKRLSDLKAQYEFYPVSGSYDRAMAGEVYVKGDYVFLIVVGVLEDMDEEAPDFSDDVQMTKETIDSFFND